MSKFISLLVLVSLGGGCSTLSLAPNEMGAQQECAQRSASLSQYNECSEHVDTTYRQYEEQRRQSEEDEG